MHVFAYTEMEVYVYSMAAHAIANSSSTIDHGIDNWQLHTRTTTDNNYTAKHFIAIRERKGASYKEPKMVIILLALYSKKSKTRPHYINNY